MAFVGASIRAAKAASENYALNKKIENLENIDSKSVLDFYQGDKRLLVASDLVDGLVSAEINNKSVDSEKINDYLNILNKEFQVMKNNNQIGSNAQIIALGLAIRELSVAMELEKRKLQELEEEFKKELSDFINGSEKIIGESINSINKEKEKIIKSVNDYFNQHKIELSKNIDKLNSLEAEINNNIESKIKYFEGKVFENIEHELELISSFKKALNDNMRISIENNNNYFQNIINLFNTDKESIIKDIKEQMISFENKFIECKEVLQDDFNKFKIKISNDLASTDDKFERKNKESLDAIISLKLSIENSLKTIKRDIKEQREYQEEIQECMQTENSKKFRNITVVITFILMFQIFLSLFFAKKLGLIDLDFITVFL